MKVIDLLNKIANGEENIRAKHKLFELDYINMENMNVYYPEKIKSFSLMTLIKNLNDEAEIIEEDKKIEKLKIVENGSINSYALLDKNGTKCALTKHSKIIADKINEIIDYINKGD